jgi:hypothetical protein
MGNDIVTKFIVKKGMDYMELTCFCNEREKLCHVCKGKGEIQVDPERLFETINNEYNSDDESFYKRGSRILDDYENASDNDKAIMNNLFISLCGYSFESLVKLSKKE